MKKKVDVFVLSVMIIFTLVNLMILSIEPLIENPVLLKGLGLIPYLGSVIVLIKFTRDFEYNLGYFVSAVLITYIIRLLLSTIIYNYFDVLDLYLEILIIGIINAVLYSYFYQLFKVYSHKRMKEENLFKHEK